MRDKTPDELGKEFDEITKGFGKGSPPSPCSDNSAWPMHDVLGKLCEAADILLDEKNYDGHGHELIDSARREARLYLKQNYQKQPSTPSYSPCPFCGSPSEDDDAEYPPILINGEDEWVSEKEEKEQGNSCPPYAMVCSYCLSRGPTASNVHDAMKWWDDQAANKRSPKHNPIKGFEVVFRYAGNSFIAAKHPLDKLRGIRPDKAWIFGESRTSKDYEVWHVVTPVISSVPRVHIIPLTSSITL